MDPQHVNFVPGLGVVDPFSRPRGPFSSFTHAVLATAIFRCWHILLFFTAWATAIYLIDINVHKVAIQSTLLTVYVGARHHRRCSPKCPRS
jgi:ion channel-forming bestrophin family protein